MTDKQPEALRLANALDSFIATSGLHSDGVTAMCSEMLRRLHAQNAQILEALRMNAQALARWRTTMIRFYMDYQEKSSAA